MHMFGVICFRNSFVRPSGVTVSNFSITCRLLSTVVASPVSQTTNINTNTHFDEPSEAVPLSITKIISTTGIYSRQEAERLVQQSRVKINGDVCRSPQYKMIYGISDSIEVDGVKLKRKYTVDNPVRLWAVRKRVGEMMSESDKDKQRALMGERLLKLLPESVVKANVHGFKPVYRLEYNTEGLCLFTNSGEFARVLNADGSQFGRHFRVRVHGLINESKMEGLRKGLFIDGIKYKPMEVTVQTKAGTISWLNITSYDNKDQSVKKCLEKVFLKITRMICVGFGSEFTLDKLIPANSPVQCKELKLTPAMNAMYLQMQNNRRGLAYKTTVKKDLGTTTAVRKFKRNQDEIPTTF